MCGSLCSEFVTHLFAEFVTQICVFTLYPDMCAVLLLPVQFCSVSVWVRCKSSLLEFCDACMCVVRDSDMCFRVVPRPVCGSVIVYTFCRVTLWVRVSRYAAFRCRVRDSDMRGI